jgi:glucokinase
LARVKIIDGVEIILAITIARTANTSIQPLVIGIAFNTAQVSAALVDERARIVAARSIPTPTRTTRAAVSAITELIIALATTGERGDSLISAIGLSVPGIVDPLTERVSIAELKGWTRLALRPLLEEALAASGYDVRTPVHQRRARAAVSASSHPAMTINTRAAALAAAESWTGAARGKANVIYVALADEIEAGILVDGRVLTGAGGMAGAVGWLAVSENYQIGYEQRGCLAHEVAGTALVRQVMESWTSRPSALGNLTTRDMINLTPATVIRAARGGDPLASQVVKHFCRWLGRGLANLIAVLNPEVIIIGGDLGLALKPFLEELYEEAQRWAPPANINQCRIVSAKAGANAEVLGAARLAWLKLQTVS